MRNYWTKSKKVMELVREFVAERKQMVVATNGEFPWICTVYYGVDDELNLYFLTSPETIHGKQIGENEKVAVAIADSPQDPSSKKKGVQISGRCVQLESEDEVNGGLELWKKALNVEDEKYSYKAMLEGKIKGRVYKITPVKIKFFNQEIWSEGEEPLVEV